MLQIDELLMRIPGMNEEDGASLGKLVAERIAAALPDYNNNQRIPEINIQFEYPFSNDSNLMADRIAEQIIRQINLTIL